jgi:hypothetical protein
MDLDVIELMRNPLTQDGRTGSFLRLVLAEAVRHGLPPQAVATLDDVAAMLGFYSPLPKGPAAHLAGPLSVWRTDPDQPIFERVSEVESLAYQQRCMVAFGGARPGHMIGTAEIIVAMGNLHRELASIPDDYRDIFEWATVDVLAILTGGTHEEIAKVRKYKVVITDDDVLKPGGRLNGTYLEITSSLRRTAIAAMESAPDNPRQYLRPLAQHFIKAHTAYLAEAETLGLTEMAAKLRSTIATIHGMYPDLAITQDRAEGDAAA